MYSSLRKDCTDCVELLAGTAATATSTPQQREHLRAFADFLLSTLHLLERFPGNAHIVQLATQRPQSDVVFQAAQAYAAWCGGGEQSGADTALWCDFDAVTEAEDRVTQ